jgi:D-alanyl-D-alanine carboxypeptidase (penicillin-binding protein 5/6)
MLAVVLGVVALLAFMASRVAGPGYVPLTHPATAQAAQATITSRNLYGSILAPPPERVALKLKGRLRSGLLFDVDTGRVLWERDPAQLLPIASLTKMMTALVVVDRAKPTDQALITTAATHYTGSGVGLLPLGKRVSVLALLYGLLLPSGNDAAIALAQDVAGNQRHFVGMMNARAVQLGLRCTHFTSVSGILDQGNYSCTGDLAILAHAVLEQPLLARIVASRSAIVPFPIKGGKLYLYNNNPLLLARYPGVDGVKTGYTDAAGQCLVAAARRGRTWLAVVLLHSANTFGQAGQLLNAGFAKERSSS